MKTTPRLASALVIVSLLAILAAMAMPVFGMDFRVTRIVLSAGAGVNLLGRLLQQPQWTSLPMRRRRLHRLEVWSGVFFVAGAVLTWLRATGEYDWVAFTLAGAVVLIYVNFALPRVKDN